MEFEWLVLRLLLVIFKQNCTIPLREDHKKLMDETTSYIAQGGKRN